MNIEDIVTDNTGGPGGSHSLGLVDWTLVFTDLNLLDFTDE